MKKCSTCLGVKFGKDTSSEHAISVITSTHHFYEHFWRKPELTSCPLDSHSPLVSNLSIILEQAKILLITIPPRLLLALYLPSFLSLHCHRLLCPMSTILHSLQTKHTIIYDINHSALTHIWQTIHLTWQQLLSVKPEMHVVSALAGQIQLLQLRRHWPVISDLLLCQHHSKNN